MTALQFKLSQQATQVAKNQPTPFGSLDVTGMNDVLNSQDYSEAARINHIPLGAGILMVLIASDVQCRVTAQRGTSHRTAHDYPACNNSAALAFIADIDSPRGGIIRVQPKT
jgi:hypothetical protein